MQSSIFSVSIRKCLISVLFDRVNKLSARSIAETSSGKLVSLISSDIFTTEKGLISSPMLVTSPLINVYAFYLLYSTAGWEHMVIVLVIWLLVLLMQSYSAGLTKKFKTQEGAFSDERLKQMNDVIEGCRTIKCFGWENHYIQRIEAIRKQQMARVFAYLNSANLGSAFYSNVGVLAMMIILTVQWKNEQTFSQDSTMGILAVVFLIFFAYN